MSSCSRCGAGPVTCEHRVYEAPVKGTALTSAHHKPRGKTVDRRVDLNPARGRYR